MKEKTYTGFIVSLKTNKVEVYKHNFYNTKRRVSLKTSEVPKEDEGSIVPTVHDVSQA